MVNEGNHPQITLIQVSEILNILQFTQINDSNVHPAPIFAPGQALFMYLEDTSEHDMFDVKPVSATAPLVMEFGRCNFSDRLMILKKYFVKHTTEEGLALSRCKDGSFHK